MKYQGSFDDLIGIVRQIGREITDTKDMGNQKQLKTKDGAIINLYISTGTLQFQGKQTPKEQLETDISSYLNCSSIPAPKMTNVTAETTISAASSSDSTKVFVVHGHDAVSKEQLELVIHKLGLNPYVLANTGGGGLTIIEALEKEIGPAEDCGKIWDCTFNTR